MRPLTRAIALTICSTALAATALAVGGTRYKWRDADGNLHYADSLPPEASARGYEVINAQGIVVRRVEPAKTAAQISAEKDAKVREQAARDVADAQSRNDQQMLAAYPTEADLKRAQTQQLQMVDQNIRSAEIGLQSQERSLSEMLGNAADYEGNGKPLPAVLSKQIADLRKQIEAQHAVVDKRRADREKTLATFASDLEHYNKLKAAEAARTPQ
ncbi:DUF4124 domain-containing protein [Dokdonella sp. MW10]|uniref:DUF4124 domain-containing protein n=1 Tax=Dokdonella sp. MW10 TaxID=2992926 RepID=UPI003F80DA9A